MTESELIHIISKSSDRYGDKLIEFLKTYHLTGLKDATQKQLQEFVINKKLIERGTWNG